MKPGSKLIFMILLAVVLVGCSSGKPIGRNNESAGNAMVPHAYRALYNELYTKLDSLHTAVNSQWNGKKSAVSFGVELLVANSNRGEILLTDRVFGATRLTLERLKDLGVRSIAISIQYPILTSSFPRVAEYRKFYKQVAEDIRRQGFVLIVEMGTMFREPEFSKLKINYNGLTLRSFKDELREMTEEIITDMRPDYLTLLTEPDTQARNTGLDFSVLNFSATIQHVASGLNRSGVRIGAGAGTWDDMAYFKALARIPQLDYLDLHTYPIQRDFVIDRALQVAATAQRYNKSVTIGEAWLYKISERELGKISPVKAFARDVFSFWQPLDIMFLETIINLSHRIQADFCSFFWMKYLYGYLDYNSRTRSLTPQQLINSVDSVAGRQILDNRLNATGNRFKTLIATE
jgi:PBP1b-binding outer membrane lipoprotein LpoB